MAGSTIPETMPDVLDVQAGPLRLTIDAGWSRDHAACTGSPSAVHPLFPVCWEWQALEQLQEKVLPPAIRRKATPITHDLTIRRMPAAGEALTTTARFVTMEAHRSGACLVARLETRDAQRRKVTSTDLGILYQGMSVPSNHRTGTVLREAAFADGPAIWQESISFCRDAAQDYAQRARIRQAREEPNLQETAILGKAITCLLQHEKLDAARVRRLCCRFGHAVGLPANLHVLCLGRAPGEGGDSLRFHVLTEQGKPVVTAGMIVLAG